MNRLPTPAYLVVCYNARGFCRSMHFDTEQEAGTWAQENAGSYTKLVVEKNVNGGWSPARKHFMIIGWPRTGSTHLVQLLNSHDDILCNGEIFQSDIAGLAVRWPETDKKVGVIEELTRLRSQNPAAFLDRIWSQNYDRECIGFKIFPGHHDEVLAELVSDASIRKVVLLRRNILAVYSSAMIARLTGQRKYRSAGSGPGWQPVIEFEPEDFIRFSAVYRDFYLYIFGKLEENRQPLHLQLYEHINDPDQIGRLLKFVGAKPAELLVSSIRKQNSPEILSRFSNPEAVSRFLEENDLDWSAELEVSGESWSPNATP